MTDRREYGMLSKRSRQILGQDVLPRAVTSGGGCTTKRASDTDGVQKEERRSQVLRAQRTHRQRTQTYIIMLEREVLRLRERERIALATVGAQQKQTDELLRILALANTPPPVSVTSDDAPVPPPPLPPLAPYMAPSISESMGGVVTARIAGSRGVHVDVHFAHDSPDADGEKDVGEHNVVDVAPAALLSDPRRGIEFVLFLETDCMDHLRGKHLDHVHATAAAGDCGISGHISTASLSLWQANSSTTTNTASHSISNSELERLLGSSLNLGLASPEVTPVQIWNHIRWLPLPGGEDALGRLTRELKQQTFCVGFGAVLHDTAVEGILKRYYPNLPPFAYV